EIKRVYGEERVPDIGLNLEALHETPSLDFLKLALVFHAGERLGRGPVVGGLEDAAEQDRHVLEFHVCALLDRGDCLVCQKCIRATDIEQELWTCTHDIYS